ncbi:MAG: alkaline phosphatase [Breznakibacter sp.]|nr:alkaline phosphatase [Breznakibacter sp.]
MKTIILLIFIFATQVFLMGECSAQDNYKKLQKIVEYEEAQVHFVPHFNPEDYKFKGNPKNIILLIGDGMGIGQIYAGYTANKGNLNLFNMNIIGFTHTQSFSDYVTDSAAGGTAIACGEKTVNGFVGLDAKQDTLFSMLYYFSKAGKSTGLVSSSAITHATPASFVAHVNKRDRYEDIAADFLKCDIDLFIGGGEKHFAEREDNRNLLEELRQKGFTVGDSTFKPDKATKLPLAILNTSIHNPKAKLRGDILPQNSKFAIELLSKNKKGFFLMVEGSQIDWGGHSNDISLIVDELLDFDKVVGAALDFAKRDKNTLVIVTADHETGGTAIVDGNIQLGAVTSNFATTTHTAVMVPVFAYGCGAEQFGGVYQNTQLFYKIMKLTGVKVKK